MTFPRAKKPSFKFSYFINSNPISSLGSSVLDLGLILTLSSIIYTLNLIKTLDLIKQVAHELKLLFAPLKALYLAFVRSI